MEIYKWLNNPLSAIACNAVVLVKAGEVADIEKMVKLLDGDSVGTFGYSVKILSVDKPPKIVPCRDKQGIIAGHKRGEEQFGFPSVAYTRETDRYYEVHVSRD